MICGRGAFPLIKCFPHALATPIVTSLSSHVFFGVLRLSEHLYVEGQVTTRIVRTTLKCFPSSASTSDKKASMRSSIRPLS
jgi:hypothetical protein